jgi:hypothetical protein
VNETDLAWAAGFIDGEGCISVIKRKTGQSKAGRRYEYHQLNINVPQIDKAPLDKLQKMFGGMVRANKAIGNRRPSFVWTIHSRIAYNTLIQLIPYLIVKQREAELALQFQYTQLPVGVKGLNDWMLAERDSFSEALKEHHKTFVYEGGDSNR